MRWRSRTTGILIGGIVIVVIAIAIAFIVTMFHPTTELHLGSSVFKAKIADDETERAKGLSGVDELNANDALLMAFDSDDKWGIWMKDMNVPIDILWLNANKKVVYIVKNATPEMSTDKTFTPKTPARYVIEVPAGTVEKSGIKVGEIAVFLLDQEGK